MKLLAAFVLFVAGALVLFVGMEFDDALAHSWPEMPSRALAAVVHMVIAALLFSASLTLVGPC